MYVPFSIMGITVQTVLGNNKVKSLFHKTFTSFGLVSVKIPIWMTFMILCEFL